MSNPESLHSLHPDSLHHQDSAAPDIKHAAGIWLLLTILCQVYVILALLAYQLDWVQVLPPYLAVSAYILAMICVLGCVATARRYGQLREQYRHLTSGPASVASRSANRLTPPMLPGRTWERSRSAKTPCSMPTATTGTGKRTTPPCGSAAPATRRRRHHNHPSPQVH